MATITYSTWTKGWTSFWSYVPDWMIGLNSSFYTFTEGKLYKHNDNTTRNNFYGVQYPSTVTTVFNDEPMQMKVFKTISEDSNKPWKATIDTELNTAEMDVSYFVEKEAEWFSYIRRVDNTIDLKAVSTQGIGNATSIDSSTASAVVVTFGFDLNKSISIGDKLYKMGVTGTNPPISDGTMVLIGTITALTATTITVDTTAGVVPLTTDFLIGVKNSQAESYGSRGFFMSVKLENNDTTQVEMFSIASSVFKSFP
tara:strand:- start:2633 stop:3397 length:765 start_codon:yes stop_codon:yes gene_type:complete